MAAVEGTRSTRDRIELWELATLAALAYSEDLKPNQSVPRGNVLVCDEGLCVTDAIVTKIVDASGFRMLICSLVREEEVDTVISIRGSVSLENWMFNLFHIGGNFLRDVLNSAAEGGALDRQVAVAVSDIFEAQGFEEALRVLHAEIREQLELNPAHRIVLVGHSMGGFLTQMFCATYQLAGVTFNAPALRKYVPIGEFSISHEAFMELKASNFPLVENHRAHMDVFSNMGRAARTRSDGEGHHGVVITHREHGFANGASLLVLRHGFLRGTKEIVANLHSVVLLARHLSKNPQCRANALNPHCCCVSNQ